jgi:hypothetical protein
MAPGDWVAYTPAWTAVTTNPTLGNGTAVGAYMQIGKTVHFRLTITAGSTTNFGSGGYRFSLPITAKSSTTRAYVFAATFLDSSANAFYISSAFNTSATVIAAIGTGTASFYSPTVPVTWASGDVFAASGTYDAA